MTSGTLDGGYVVVSQATNVLNCLTDASFDGSAEQIDDTCKNTTGATSSRAGATSWSVSGSGNHQEDAAANTGFWDLMTIWKAKTEVTVRVGSAQTGDKYVEGTSYISSISLQAGNTGSNTTFSVTFTGKGDVTIGTNV